MNKLITIIIVIVKIIIVILIGLYIFNHGAKLIGSIVKRVKNLPTWYKKVSEEKIAQYKRSVSKV